MCEQLLLKIKRTLDQFQGILHSLITSLSFSYGTRLTTWQQRMTIVNKKSCTLAQQRSLKQKGKIDYMLTNTHTDCLLLPRSHYDLLKQTLSSCWPEHVTSALLDQHESLLDEAQRQGSVSHQ